MSTNDFFNSLIASRKIKNYPICIKKTPEDLVGSSFFDYSEILFLNLRLQIQYKFCGYLH